MSDKLQESLIKCPESHGWRRAASARLSSRGQAVHAGAIAITLCFAFAVASGNTPGRRAVQQTFPAPPSDRTLIYWWADAALNPLPLEMGTTNLRPEVPAGSDKMGRVELKGETAATVIGNSEPHFFLFVPDASGVHPPLLVRLTSKRGARRVTAMAQRGQRGFAIVSEEIVKPHYRVLARDGGMIYMEVWGREPLQSGEYAFIGSELGRIATFNIRQK